MTGANVLDALEIRLVPYTTQRRLRQDFKLATQEDNESIQEWARRVNTQCQRVYDAIADRKAIQWDQFVNELTDLDIQESLWKGDINEFGPIFERALRLDCINKAKHLKQCFRK